MHQPQSPAATPVLARRAAWRACAVAVAVALGGCRDPDDAAARPWRQIAGPGPTPRWGHVAVVDPVRAMMVVFGGMGAGGRLGDLWVLSLADEVWTRVDAPGGPSPRITAAAVLDGARHRMLVVGGETDQGASGEVWALDLRRFAWTRLAGGPTPRFDVAGATDGRRAWFYAGFAAPFATLDDLWELDLTTDAWRALPAPGARPEARSNVGFAHHDGALYVTGGHGAFAATPDTWRYDLAAGRWERLEPQGATAASAHFAYAVDPACATLWLAGGDNVDYYDVAFTEGLTLGSVVRFQRLRTSRLPPPRRHATLVLGPSRQLVLFGGWQGMGTLLGDTWISPTVPCP